MSKWSVPISIAAAAALLLAGCGGGSAKASASGSATSTTTAGGRTALNSSFTACLKQHGVSLPGGFGGRRPGGGSGPRGGTGFRGRRARGGSGLRGGFFGGGAGLTAKQQAAFSACRSKLPNGGRFGGFGNGAGRAALQAYLSCLGDHGVTVPKPASTSASSGSGPAGFGSPLQSVRRDPKFAAANKICAALLPARGGAAPPA